ncbi:MAG: hypothetical protein AB1640_12985 [bacterium]
MNKSDNSTEEVELLRREMESLKKRMDRLYHWLYAVGVAAGILGLFGIKLQFDLKEAMETASDLVEAKVAALKAIRDAGQEEVAKSRESIGLDLQKSLEPHLVSLRETLAAHANRLQQLKDIPEGIKFQESWRYEKISGTLMFEPDGKPPPGGAGHPDYRGSAAYLIPYK